MIDNVVAVSARRPRDSSTSSAAWARRRQRARFGLDVTFTDDEWEQDVLLARSASARALRSRPPLFGLEHVLSDKADAGISQLTGGDFGDGAVVTIGGIISGLQRKMTKQGNAWAIATVEDLAGSIECMFFPATYQLVSTQLVEDAVVFVKAGSTSGRTCRGWSRWS
ncbi:hypothetical protein GCM10023238_12420 [Streptomyces heliomycini]